MKILDGIRAVGTQTIRTTDENGAVIEITLKYRAATSEWFMDLVFGSFRLNGHRITNSLNTIWAHAKQLKFGIGVIVSDGGEPFLINDFSTGRVQLAILTNGELDLVDDYYVGCCS
jgi:hypothetical protein